MDKSSSPMAPPSSMVNMSSSPPPPPSSLPPGTPSSADVDPADMSDIQAQLDYYYPRICRTMWDQYLRQQVIGKGLNPKDMKPEQITRMKELVGNAAKLKAREMVRIHRQKRLQQRQLLEHSHAHGHGHSPTPAMDISPQLPLPAFTPQPASSSFQPNTFQPVLFDNQAPPQSGDQTLPTSYQPDSSPVLSLFQPDTPTPAPVNRMPLLTMPLSSHLSGAAHADGQANGATSVGVMQTQETDQNHFNHFQNPAHSPTNPGLHPIETYNQQTPAFSEYLADDSLQDTKTNTFPAGNDADSKQGHGTWENDLFGDTEQGAQSSTDNVPEVQYQGIMVPYESLDTHDEAAGSPGTNLNHNPQESIQEIGIRVDAASFLARKQFLNKRIHHFNAVLNYPNHLGYLAEYSFGVTNISIALADVIVHASGLANLRHILNHRRDLTRPELLEKIRLAHQNIPKVMPQAPGYVKMWLEAVNCHQAQWSAASKCLVEVYHVFSCLKASLHKLDQEASPGLEVLVDELGVTRADLWAYLAPLGDDEL